MRKLVPISSAFVVFIVSGVGLSRVLRGFWTPESSTA